MVAVFQSALLIALMIAIGALLSRTFSFNDDTRQMLTSLIIYIAMPSIILSSIFNIDVDANRLQNIAIVFMLSIIINLTGIGLGWFFATLSSTHATKRGEIGFLSGLGNTGFIGIPLCATLFGPEGALYAAIFDAGVDFTIWTVGVLILQNKRRLTLQAMTSLLNAPLIAIVVGLLAAVLNIKPPGIFVQLTDHFASLAVPLAMFYIGIMIMTFDRSKMSAIRSHVWLPIIVKLIVLPFFVVSLLQWIDLVSVVRQTVLIQSMMPSVMIAPILFAKYAKDGDMATVTTVTSTVIALVTIPFLLYVIVF